MTWNRAVLKVGELKILGDRFDFRTLESVFAVPPGAEAEIALLYSYEEASADREDMRLVFTTDVDGAPPGRHETTVTDRPVIHDQQYGVLSIPIKAPPHGQRIGRFRIEAHTTKGSWLGRDKDQTAHFATEGRFLVRIDGVK